MSAFLQAGQGLVAAHDADMIHRDFKVDNVFVGNDGRIRVGDFGLARSASGLTLPARRAHAPKDDLGPLVSREGILAGTPAYMAPDQLRGDPADARSDQFSFCAALHEGLYWRRAVRATTLEELVDKMEANRLLPAPPNSAVPGWLRAVVLRGLLARPEDQLRHHARAPRRPGDRPAKEAGAARGFRARGRGGDRRRGALRAEPPCRAGRVPRARAPPRRRLGRGATASHARRLRGDGQALRGGHLRALLEGARRVRRRVGTTNDGHLRRPERNPGAEGARAATRRVSR